MENMRRFKTIDDMIIPGEVRLLDPETEKKIIEELEELEEKRKMEEARAIMEARNTFIW